MNSGKFTRSAELISVPAASDRKRLISREGRTRCFVKAAGIRPAIPTSRQNSADDSARALDSSQRTPATVGNHLNSEAVSYDGVCRHPAHVIDIESP